MSISEAEDILCRTSIDHDGTTIQSRFIVFPLLLLLVGRSKYLGPMLTRAFFPYKAGAISPNYKPEVRSFPLAQSTFLRFRVPFIMLAQSVLPLLLAATSTLALSFPRGKNCSVPATALNLQPPFPPLSTPPRYVALGVGVQNYTCNSSGNYT
jgi:hypothetical protein